MESTGGVRIRGCSVVVTGASSGIGRAVAERMAAGGARVLAVARSMEPLADLAGAHPGITALAADVSRDEGRAAVAEAAGGVDVLVNNAGIGWVGLVEQMPAAEVRRLFELNVLGLVDLTQRVLPGMLERRRGHVVNLASVASWVAVPPLTVYAATKFAVQGFSEGLRREVAGRGVAVTTINPGPVATRFGSRATGGDRPSGEMPEARMPGVPPAMVARAVLRAVRAGGRAGYATVAVPRVAGLARLGSVPGLRLAVDAGAAGLRGPRIRALGALPTKGSGDP